MHICVCKWGPPLSKTLISSISGKLCMIISWNWCIHICFHGQGLSYYHLKCCSIICILCVCKWGPPLSRNKFSSISGKLCMIIIMKMVSTHMFPWSRINIMSLKCRSVNIYVCTHRCHAYHHVVLGMHRDTDEGFQSGYLSWSSIWWYEWDYHRRDLGAGHESIPYRVSCIAAKLSPYWCKNIWRHISLYGGSTETNNR